MNSDSDSDDDIFLDGVNGETTQVNHINEGTNGGVNFYQLQHKSDDIFTFKSMGCFVHEPCVSLGNFNSEGKSFYLESNFIKKETIKVNVETIKVNVETNEKLYPMMSIYINNSGRLIRLVMGIELNVNYIDIKVDKDYTGLAYIELVDLDKNYREIIKRGLIFPGSTKIVYFLVKELSNEKITAYINGETDKGD